MSDLLARLRDTDTTRRIGESYADTHERRHRDREEAADRIEQLEVEGDKARARGDALRMALEDIAYGNPLHNEDDLMRIARAALEASDE